MTSFRQHLLRRLLVATAIGSIACSTQVRNGDGDGDGGGSEGGGSQGGANVGGYQLPPPDDSWESEECFDWPQQPGAGGSGGSGIGGSGGSGGSGGGVDQRCPAASEAEMYMQGNAMICPPSIQSMGTFIDGQCCYDVLFEDCGVGRPFVDDGGRAITAHRARSKSWTAGGARPSLAGLSAGQREALAARWQRDAFLEHASVASFGRFALELLAVGAPARLVAAAHAAALDEVRHAERCFDLARAYGAEAADPGPMPMGGSVTVSADPAEIARRAVIEGCVGETLAAVLASEQHRLAVDPVVRETLAVIAQDEARHAELAWAAVAWLIQFGGDAVRSAVRNAFEEALAACRQPMAAASDAVPSHGLLDKQAERRITSETLEQIVAPAAALLV